MLTINYQVLVAIFLIAIFVSAVIETIKGISAMGIVGLIRAIWDALMKNKWMKPEEIKSLNFILALFYCWLFKIKLIASMLNFDPQSHIYLTAAVDYFTTASVCYVGADWFFARVIALKNTVQNAKTELDK